MGRWVSVKCEGWQTVKTDVRDLFEDNPCLNMFEKTNLDAAYDATRILYQPHIREYLNKHIKGLV